MQKAFIKETNYWTILNRAPAKLAPASMPQLSTRGCQDPGEPGPEMWLNMKVLSLGYRVISSSDKLMVQMLQQQRNCLYMKKEHRQSHTKIKRT